LLALFKLQRAAHNASTKPASPAGSSSDTTGRCSGMLSAAGDPLERLAAVVDFELFRDHLEAALERSDRSKGGRPRYDAILMFKVLVLQTVYTLSDDQTEYQIKDRGGFRPARHGGGLIGLLVGAGMIGATPACDRAIRAVVISWSTH
jgi:hypothetical protein